MLLRLLIRLLLFFFFFFFLLRRIFLFLLTLRLSFLALLLVLKRHLHQNSSAPLSHGAGGIFPFFLHLIRLASRRLLLGLDIFSLNRFWLLFLRLAIVSLLPALR